MSTNVGSATGYLDLDISGFLAGLQSAQSAANTQTRNMATVIGNNISSIGRSLTSAGTTLTKAVTVPIVGVGAAGLKTAMNFEKGMSEVRAISGATGKDLDALKEKAIDLGATTAFSAGEVASAMTEMAKAGWNSQQIIDGMGGVLDAAAASGEELAVVATIVADAITGFGMEASESTRIADLLTQAANSGTIGITDLGETFKYIAPIAGAMGLKIEEVTTAVAAMSMAGIKGSSAGTALRTMLSNLVNPAGQAVTAIEDLGLSAINADGSMKSLDEIVSMLRASFDGLTEAEKTQYAAMLAGQEGMSGLLSLLNLTKEEYDEIAVSMENAGGVAQETAAIMQDNLQSKVEQLGGSLESLAIKFGDLLIPYVRQFVEWLTSLVDKFTALDPETQKTIIKFAALAAIVGPLLVVFGLMITSIGAIATTFGKIPGAIKTVTTGFNTLVRPIKNIGEASNLAKAGFTALAGETSKFGTTMGLAGGGFKGFAKAVRTSAKGAISAAAKAVGVSTGAFIGLVAAIALVTAAFVSLWKNNEEFRENIAAIWNQIGEIFSGFTQGIVDRLNSLGFDFENITEVIKAIWQGFCDFLAPVFEGAFQFIADTFKFITDYILGVFDMWIAFFKGDWEGVHEAVKSIFLSVWNFIKSTFENVLNIMKGILDAVCKWFGTTWSETWNNIKTFFSSVWNSIKNTVSTVINNIKGTISNVFNGIKNTVSSVWNGIMNAIKTPIEKARDIVKGAVDAIKGFFGFKISWPKIPMPHFAVSPSGWKIGDLLKGEIPKLSIDWYAKAMNGGMILNSPTIFGYDPITGKFLGGGEAGSETIVGTESLMKMIRSAVVSVIGPMVEATYQLTKASHELGYITNNAFARQTQVYEQIVRNRGDDNGGGNTFIFNSPKAIDEVEAARQMKKTQRELAEGF